MRNASHVVFPKVIQCWNTALRVNYVICLSAPDKHLCKFDSFHTSQFGCTHMHRIPCSAARPLQRPNLDIPDSLPSSGGKLGCKVSKTSQGLFPLSMFTSNQRYREAWKLPRNLLSFLPQPSGCSASILRGRSRYSDTFKSTWLCWRKRVPAAEWVVLSEGGQWCIWAIQSLPFLCSRWCSAHSHTKLC